MKHFASILLLLVSYFAQAHPCPPDSLRTHQIRASQTDPNIAFELNRHYAWLNTGCTPRNQLLVHMVGTFDNPRGTTLFPSLAANHGFHVISLKYPNGTSAQSPCRNSTDPNCYSKFRREIIEGIDYSTEIQVDSSDCIQNRLTKLLKYLESNHPTEGWGQFFTGDSVHWEQLLLSGHSQGGGHAALMAKGRPVSRVIMFASPNDYSEHFNRAALWASQPSLIPDSIYFAFGNRYDDIVDFEEQYLIWQELGVTTDTLRIQGNSCPYNQSQLLYTVDTMPGLGINHSNMVRDNETSLDNMGNPVYEEVWKYLLGIPCGRVGVEEEVAVSGFEFRVYPNPAEDVVTVATYCNTSLRGDIEIIDFNGRLLWRQKMTSSDVIIDLGRFQKGLLFVKVWDEEKTQFHVMKLWKL
jgi:hypothetical protein